MWSRSQEVLVALKPEASYRQLMNQPADRPGPRLLERLGVVLLVIATVVPAMAVQRVTVGLAATAALSWSFVLAIQLAVGALVIASAPARRISLTGALDLWFAAHLPYTLWMFGAAIVMATWRHAAAEVLIASAILPAAWTTILISAFCRVVLDTTPRGARWRAAAHQVLIWAIALGYVVWAAGGWFQIAAAVGRLLS
jgi:hypothetical protein